MSNNPFITDEFIAAYNECCENLPDLTNLDWNIFLGSTYLDWEEVLSKRRKILIDRMYNKGFYVTENMLNTFEMWQANNMKKKNESKRSKQFNQSAS